MKNDSFDQIFADKNRVLIVMPHPDDAELYCGGTVARLIESGVEVMMIKMTNGGKGTRQTSISEEKMKTLRSQEDHNAAHTLGIKAGNNIQLDIPDGEVESNLETIEKVAYHIRKFRPDLIITCNPEDVFIRFAKDISWVNHRDHRSTARVAIDAAYPYSRDHAFFPKQLVEISEPYKPTTYFLLSDYYDHTDVIYIEITNYLEKKTQAWQCHENAYTKEKVNDSVEFLNKDGDRFFETFRFVIAD
jgi:LmbE family N-acetylglucosaminyl deacetylase